MTIKLDASGLVPAIVQDADSGEILMMAWMNETSLRKTLETKQAWFYSRSRKELWHKGDTSGSFINVSSVAVDCDGDTILVKGKATGPVCHTGNKTCFFQGELTENNLSFESAEENELDHLFKTIEQRKRDKPEGSYVAALMKQGVDRISKKVIEEAGETVIAAKNHVHSEIAWEVADLWFHSLILLSYEGMTPEDIYEELRKRRR